MYDIEEGEREKDFAIEETSNQDALDTNRVTQRIENRQNKCKTTIKK